MIIFIKIIFVLKPKKNSRFYKNYTQLLFSIKFVSYFLRKKVKKNSTKDQMIKKTKKITCS